MISAQPIRQINVVAYPLPMRVKVLYFAVLRDLCGQSTEEIDLPAGESVGTLLKRLALRSTAQNKLWDSIAVAVNQEYAQSDLVLHDGDEVALLPPVSGGCAAQEIEEIQERQAA
jgi:molybdopterin converting factor subunit 1